MSLLIIIFTLVLPVRLLAGGPDTETEQQVRDILAQQATYQTVRAVFRQERQMQIMEEPLRGGGIVYYAKPNRMRWVYTEPMEYYLISNGDTLWFYIPEYQQVQVVDLRGNAAFRRVFETVSLGSTRVFEQLVKHFDFIVQDKEEKIVMTMRPLKGLVLADFFTEGIIKLDASTMLPQQIMINDVNGDQLKLEFAEVEIDIELADSLFEFVPPPEVEVINLDGGMMW